MNPDANQANAQLESWGATPAECERILPFSATQEEMVQRLDYIQAIDDCLKLLHPDANKRKQFMHTASRSEFFAGRTPMEVIASGTLSDLADSYQTIRRFLCI